MKPDYVERDGDTVYRPPYEQRDTFLTAWMLRSDRALLQQILDHDLNRPSNRAVDYRPLSSTVLLSIADIKQIHSLDARDKNYGYIHEIDVCVWILTGAYKEVGGRRELDHFAWYVPYIWVDNPYAMSTGRETVGYPKAIGWMNIPTSPHDPGPLWLDSLVLPTHTPTTEVTRKRIFTLTREPTPHGPLTEWATDARQAFTGIARMMFDGGDLHCDWDFLVNSFHDLLGGHMPLVFLKQFRDSDTSTKACYQSILEANATVTSFRKGGLLPGDWRLDVDQFASLQMRSRLGLAPQTVVEQGFWLDFSFSMDLGREIWRAP